MPAKKTLKDCHDLAAKRGGKFLSTEYVNSGTKYLWICNKGHKWATQYNHVQQGNWCPVCAGKAKKTLKDCHALAKKRGGKFLSTEYVNVSTKYLWQCEKGHKWEARYKRVRKGDWCPFCAGVAKKTLESCYDLADKRGGKFLSEKYLGTHFKYLWQCKKGHKWSAKYNAIQQGKWCSVCAGTAKRTLKDCHNLAAKRGGEFLSEKCVNSKTKYLWQCEKGHEWSAVYSSIQSGGWCPVCGRERAKVTNLKRYGVEHVTQNIEIALKGARKMNRSQILSHWKTNEELVCVGSYEKKVVDFLNKNEIKYLWQPKTFVTTIYTKKGNRSTYRPDLYLVDNDVWIEIKGYFRKDAQEKWNWFHKECPNSELWDKKKLKEMRIL